MNIKTKICKLHQEYHVTHICIYRHSALQSRWCCVQCIKQGIHEHYKKDQTYLIQWQDIRLKKLQMISKLYNNQLLSEGLIKCKQLFSLIQEQQKFIQQQVEKMIIDKQKLKLFISDLTEENFIQLDDKRINEIININLNQFGEEKQFTETINNINENVDQLKAIMKKYQENLHLVNNPFDLNQRKYTLKQIATTSKTYRSTDISNDEQYLAYSDENKQFKIYDIRNSKIIKEFKSNQVISVCQFTQDSSMLYVGFEKGYVKGYDASNNFKLIFRSQLHRGQIRYIKTIQNKYMITASYDGKIKKTDLKMNKQIFKLISEKYSTFEMDYNLIDDILAESFYNAMKLWDCKNKNLIIYNRVAHPRDIYQIQFINNNQNMLSLDEGCFLYKWWINLHDKALTKIQEFYDCNKIQSFSQFNSNQNLLLICQDCIKILNLQGQTIYQLEIKDQYKKQKNYIQCKILLQQHLKHLKHGLRVNNLIVVDIQFQDQKIKLVWLQLKNETLMRRMQLIYNKNIISFGLMERCKKDIKNNQSQVTFSSLGKLLDSKFPYGLAQQSLLDCFYIFSYSRFEQQYKCINEIK